MNLGFGIMHAGVSPYGLLEPAESDVQPIVLGEARYIDPETKDHVLDEDGNYLQTSGTRSRVLLALTTTLNSSSVLPGLGHDLKSITKLDSTAEKRLKSKVLQALRQLIEVEKAIAVDSILVTILSGKVEITVSFRDLISNEPDVALVKF